MNTTSEAASARDSLETEIRISRPEDSIRERLQERVALLTDAEAILAHSYVVATQIEDVKITVEMLVRFLGLESEITEEAV